MTDPTPNPEVIIDPIPNPEGIIGPIPKPKAIIEPIPTQGLLLTHSPNQRLWLTQSPNPEAIIDRIQNPAARWLLLTQSSTKGYDWPNTADTEEGSSAEFIEAQLPELNYRSAVVCQPPV